MKPVFNISKPLGVSRLVHKNGTTLDIINTITWADKQPEHGNSTKAVAESLRGKDLPNTLYNVWYWVKNNVRYVLDPIGKQFVKSPAATWRDGYSDCKSRSLFITSFLKNLKIPYGYRFASYTGSYPFSHVYVVVKANGKEYILDPDMPKFNIQKTDNLYFKDYMSEISYVAGIGKRKFSSKNLIKKALNEGHKYKPGKLHIYRPIGEMTDFDMNLAILKQRDEIQKGILERLSGIGCPHVAPIDQRLNTYNKVIELQKSKLKEVDKLAGIGLVVMDHFEQDYPQLSGIGILKKLRGKVKAVAKKVSAKAANVAKKVVTVAKKAGKAVLKVATAPQRLAVKGILEVSLPSAAPFFLYLFITNKQTIESLPPKARAKRKKSEKVANFIVNVIGMKQDHFMGIVRNGIMKKYGKSPEKVLATMITGPINGAIGLAPVIVAAIPIIKKIIATLMKVFGKKGESITEQDAPSPDDFATASHSQLRDMSKQVLQSESSNHGANDSMLDTNQIDNSITDNSGTSVQNTADIRTNTNTRKSGIC